MADNFVGHYKLTQQSKNFDDFMSVLGVNIALRKIGNMSKPEVTVKHIEGDRYEIKEWNDFKSHKWNFTLGEEFSDKTVDGRDVMTTISMDGDVLVMTERPKSGGDIVTLRWSLTDDKGISGTAKVKDVVATRQYKRLDS